MFVVKLRKAYCHFATTGTGGGDHNEVARSLDIIVFAVTVVADDKRDIGGIIGNMIVTVYRDTKCFQTFFERLCSRLIFELRDYNATNKQINATESVDQAEDFFVIRDAEVAAAFILLDCVCRNNDNDFGKVFELKKHFDLTVWLEAGQYARCVVIVK